MSEETWDMKKYRLTKEYEPTAREIALRKLHGSYQVVVEYKDFNNGFVANILPIMRVVDGAQFLKCTSKDRPIFWALGEACWDSTGVYFDLYLYTQLPSGLMVSYREKIPIKE